MLLFFPSHNTLIFLGFMKQCSPPIRKVEADSTRLTGLHTPRGGDQPGGFARFARTPLRPHCTGTPRGSSRGSRTRIDAKDATFASAWRLAQSGVPPRMPRECNAGVRVVTNQNLLMVRASGKTPVSWEVEKDFRPLSFTANGVVTGEVVFAGYGLCVPGKGAEGYDSYAGLDVTNRIVLALRYVPEDVTPKRRQELNRYAGLRYKAMLARERGAKAVLFVTGPNSPNGGELAGLSFDSSLAGSGILAASISSNVENPHAEGGFVMTNVEVKISAGVEYIKRHDHNVLGLLPPARRAASEFVLVGAHYDHLGHGETGAMLRKGEEGQIHYGADDNASGTAVVLELAAELAGERAKNPETFQRGIIFALWSGEELGLIGSSFFVEHPLVPLSNIVAYVNFDMVGRLNENKLMLQGAGSSLAWRRLAEKRNVAAGFNPAHRCNRILSQIGPGAELFHRQP